MMKKIQDTKGSTKILIIMIAFYVGIITMLALIFFASK